MLSTSQLPKGTSCLTHSTLRSFHVMLVGSSIQVVYETIAHNSSARKGAAINARRRRRLRLAAASRRCARRASIGASGAETGDESSRRLVMEARRPLAREAIARTGEHDRSAQHQPDEQ